VERGVSMKNSLHSNSLNKKKASGSKKKILASGIPKELERKSEQPKIVISLQGSQFKVGPPTFGKQKKINTPKVKLNDDILSQDS